MSNEKNTRSLKVYGFMKYQVKILDPTDGKTKSSKCCNTTNKE